MFDVYLAVGDWMSIDYYSYQDACREGFFGRQQVGSAALFSENEESLFPEFAQRDLKARGETVFDWLVEIIREHGPDGAESEDAVELILQ